LRRAIEANIEDPLAEELLRQEFRNGTLIRIRVRDDHLFFDAEAPSEPEPPQVQATEAATS
jgi:ATP-dependent Clp protease ATP-binding subunit ClpA